MWTLDMCHYHSNQSHPYSLIQSTPVRYRPMRCPQVVEAEAGAPSAILPKSGAQSPEPRSTGYVSARIHTLAMHDPKGRVIPAGCRTIVHCHCILLSGKGNPNSCAPEAKVSHYRRFRNVHERINSHVLAHTQPHRGLFPEREVSFPE